MLGLSTQTVPVVWALSMMLAVAACACSSASTDRGGNAGTAVDASAAHSDSGVSPQRGTLGSGSGAPCSCPAGYVCASAATGESFDVTCVKEDATPGPVDAGAAHDATVPVDACAANAGTSCTTTSSEPVSGCSPGLVCQNFDGAWYNSPNGCTPSPCEVASGDDSSVFSCSAGPHAPRCSLPPVTPDGQCHPYSFIGPNGYFEANAIDASACTTMTSVSHPGTIQCDGSCQ